MRTAIFIAAVAVIPFAITYGIGRLFRNSFIEPSQPLVYIVSLFVVAASSAAILWITG